MFTSERQVSLCRERGAQKIKKPSTLGPGARKKQSKRNTYTVQNYKTSFVIYRYLTF